MQIADKGAGIATYTIALGNRVERKGHRADCAQVTVEFDVVAHSLDEAVQILKDEAAAAKACGRETERGKPITDPAWVHSKIDPFIGILSMRVYLNGDAINVRAMVRGA
jgi:hypothetical protein